MKRLLIVEDDQIVANIYRNKFSVEGFQVEIALDGQAGMEMLQTFKPEIVILDLLLPKVSGVELTKYIRSDAGLKHLPVIVFSNTYLTNLVQDAWKAGATKCLSKANCTPKQILEVVRGLISPDNGAGVAEQPAANQPSAAPANTPAIPTSRPHGQSDADFQSQLRKNFIQTLPGNLTGLRSELQTMIKSDQESTRLSQANQLYRRVHALTGNAALAGLSRIARMCDALEALLKELHEKPKSLNSSTLRTAASAIDFLGVLFEKGLSPDQEATLPANILVIDDEAISRRAITYALDKADLKCTGIEDPLAALKLLSEKTFDLVFLDVDMPVMSGFELCTKLRALPAHKKTPVVFVTGLNDFESRANSTMSGGTDFIAKPFLFIELAVKALVYIMRGQLEKKSP